MTMLIDPALLYGTGYAFGRRCEDENAGRAGAIAVSGAVLAVSVAIYCDAPGTRPLWEPFGGKSGRDLILNSWVLKFDPANRSLRRRIVVAALFASYPLWAAMGVKAGRRSRQRRSNGQAPPALRDMSPGWKEPAANGHPQPADLTGTGS